MVTKTATQAGLHRHDRASRQRRHQYHVASVTGDYLILELEPKTGPDKSSAELLSALEMASAAMDQASTLKALCDVAATEFRKLTGYDRVMVYRFLDDGAGTVLAEDRRPDLHSFVNHHFPASDIPQQARALYIRNLLRVIPDVNYVAAVLQPAWQGNAPLDMSDSILRSVSPIHLQYLRNMGVAASASISIVKDGVLWGLIACHNETPKSEPFPTSFAPRAGPWPVASRARSRPGKKPIPTASACGLRGSEDETIANCCRATARWTRKSPIIWKNCRACWRAMVLPSCAAIRSR